MESVVPQVLALGSKGLYETLFGDVFRGGERHCKEDLRSYCFASRYRVGAQFDGALQLLLNIGALVDEDEYLLPDAAFLKAAALDGIGSAVCGRLLERLAASGEIESYLPSACVSWGTGDGEMNLHLSRVPIKALPVVKLLRDLGVTFDSEESAVLLKVREPFSSTLRNALFTGAKHKRRTRALTPEELVRLQDADQKQGAEAEAFVLDLEVLRLKGHPQLSLVRRVSEVDVSMGYDIESFEGLRSFMPDRFIEVKSYRASERFFISSGEIEVAKELGERYYLYLIDIRKIDLPAYSPTIIRNPAMCLFGVGSGWSVVAVNFEITRTDTFGQGHCEP